MNLDSRGKFRLKIHNRGSQAPIRCMCGRRSHGNECDYGKRDNRLKEKSESGTRPQVILVCKDEA